MAPSSIVRARDMPRPQTASAQGGAPDPDVETAVWSMPAAASQQQTAATNPAPAPEAAKKKPSVVLVAGGLMAGLLVVLVVGFALALKVGSRHHQATPAPTATQTRGPHLDLPVPEGNATADPAAASITTTTASEASAAESTTSAQTTTSPEAAAQADASTATATTTATVAEATSTSSSVSTSTSLRGAVKCYNFYSQLNINPLQKYPENPDSKTFGFATCGLCTNGTARCTSLLHGGRSELIASHIHLAEGPDADGSKSEGPPVINFCGSNAQGLILDGADYTQPCEQWKDGAAHNKDVEGALVPNFNRGVTAAQRVEDIVKRPHMYYFNFHSLASWNHWYPAPHGMARGVMVLQGMAQ